MKLASFSVGGYGHDYETCKKKEQPQSHKVHIAREIEKLRRNKRLRGIGRLKLEHRQAASVDDGLLKVRKDVEDFPRGY